MPPLPARAAALIDRHGKVLRFITSGGTAAAVHFAVLILLVEVFAVYAVTSSVIAFLVAFAFSFILQKLWTFRNFNREAAGRQAVIYFAIAGTNFFINAGLMFLFIEYLALPYLIAQVLTSGLIAIESYFLYQHVVFKESVPVLPV